MAFDPHSVIGSSLRSKPIMTSADSTLSRSVDQATPIARANPWKIGFIAYPAYDLSFFILSPLIALSMILLLDTTQSGWAMQPHAIFGYKAPLLVLFISVWTYAHLFAVVFRSHVNQTVFKRHRIRFVIVPALLFLSFVGSPMIRVIGLGVAIFWDIYHSSMQNFGLGRIYDANLGNPAEQGRGLDIWMNHLAYIGPIFIGINFQYHFHLLQPLELAGLNTQHIVTLILTAQQTLGFCVISAAAIFIPYYIYRYWKMSREGYQVSPQKILLILSVATGSTWAWGFLRPVEAFFVANFFHGLQYFAIVWWTEKKSLAETLHLPKETWGRNLALAFFLFVVTVVGVWYLVMGMSSSLWAASLASVIALMHFWYDGFIWSVRKQEI